MADPFEGLDRINEWQEELYVHFHKNPELSMAEKETAAEITRRLESFGYQIQELAKLDTDVLEKLVEKHLE